MSKDDDIVMVNNELLFNPYNSKNKWISLSTVQTILNKYGILVPLKNYDLYKQSFVHRSYCKRPVDFKIKTCSCPSSCIELQEKSNERLEFLGDGILECVTKYYLYRRFYRENEGFMTEKKILLVKNEAIGKLSYDMNLHEWYILSNHTEEKKMRTNFKKLGCLFEAFIGAIFIDLGFESAQTFIETVYEKHIDWTEILLCDDNYKNILQVKIQKEFKTTPEYLEISSLNIYHMGVYLCIGQPIWKTSVKQAIPFEKFGSFESIQEYIKNHSSVLIFLGDGKHKIKKKAEQMACEQVIQKLI
jgi:dsRNA-specific ribonuclease